jgi:drug/metabolite transporter (DMT)-like permease
MGIIAVALSAALVYGAADFLGGLASRRTSTLAVVVWSQAAGFLVLAVALPLSPGAPQPADLGWGALCGVIGAGAVGLLYRGLAIGAMGVVSPITAVLAAVLPVAYGALRHTLPSLAASIGIALSLVAVIAISAVPPASRQPARRGIGEALGAGVLFGVFFIVLAQTRTGAGLYPLLGARTASLVTFVLAGTLLRVSYRPARSAIGIIVLGGVCDMLANVLFLIAAHGGLLAIVAVLTSLYPASTVALAAVFLHERLRAVQWAGVGLALTGVAFISAGK